MNTTAIPGKALYPRVFVTPEGRGVGIRKMAAALKELRANPDREYPGWNWYPTPGRFILNELRRGMHDRINRRALQ